MLHHGLDPETSQAVDTVEAAALKQICERNDSLLLVAAPVLDQTYRAVGRSGCGVMLSDAEGTILDRRVGNCDEAGFTDAGLVAGGRWGEAYQGTNGIGTCLAEDRPMVIHREQHFASRNIGISCMDAPIHDALGQLTGALDVSSCRDDHGTAMAEMIGMLVRDAARRIERDLFCRHFAEARIVFLSDDAVDGTALLAADRDGLVVGASRAARLRLALSDASFTAPQPLEQVLGEGGAASFDDGDRTVLRQALARAGGNASAAARALGIGRATFYRRMARTGMRD